MKFIFPFLVFCLLLTAHLTAQSFEEQIVTYREHFKQEMLDDDRAPLQKEDLQYLRWYAPREEFNVRCVYIPSAHQAPIDVPTSSGRVKSFQEVGILTFTLAETPCTLHVYRNMTLAHLRGGGNGSTLVSPIHRLDER